MEPVRITATSGGIEVTAEARTDVAVDRGQRHPMAEALDVQGSSAGVAVRVPTGTDLVVGSHSGSVRIVGAVGDLRVTTRSGSVEVDSCRSLDARTVSGRVDVGTVARDALIKAASGRVSVERVGGALSVTAVSGRIEVGSAGGEVHATSVNGRVDIGLDAAVDARCESVSGALTIGIPGSVTPKLRLRSVSGKCESKVVEGDDCTIVGRSISGGITVRTRR